MLARQPLAALGLVLALAMPAHATVYFASGFDLCVAPDDTDTTYWSDVVNAPAITTTVEATTGNLCALRFTPASGAAQYAAPATWSAASALRVSCRITPRATGGGSCTREVLSLVGSGGDWGGKAAILAMRASGTGVTLQAFYGSMAQKTCSGSPALGKQCSTVADCPELRPGEAQCAATAFAATPVMAIGTTYAFTFTQDNGSGSTAGTTTLGLYEGTAGLASEAYSRGGGTRIVGECSGGTNDLAPCNVASECPLGSCVVTNVVAPTTVRFGSSDTTSCAPQFDLDDCWVYDGDVRQNVRFETLYPNAAPTMDTNWDAVGSANSCASDADAWRCLSDGDTGPNGNDSALGNGNAAKPTVAIDMRAWSTPSPLPTPRAVAFEWVAQDTATGGSNATTARLEPKDDHGTYSGATAFFFDTFTGTGGTSEPYYQAPSVYREAASDSSAWDFASIDALSVVFNKTAGSGNEGRITSLLATVIGQTADPVVPTVIKDRDQDGEDTVCFVGDSTWDNVDFQNAIVANLVEPTNIYFYTRGGSHVGDAAAEWLQLLEGTTSTYLGLAVAKGTSGKTCDLTFLSHTVNWVFGQHLVDPKLPTALLGLGQAGYCEMQGAAGQGDPCYCPVRHPQTTNLGGTPAPNITPAKLYCVNSGAFRSTPVPVLPGYCACSANADCTHGMRTPGGLHTPAPCNTTFGYCGTGSNYSVDASALTRAAWAMPGCLDGVGCSGGVCVRKPHTGDLDALVTALTDATAARPTPNPAATPAGTSGPPIVVWVAAPHLAVRDNVSLGTDQSVIGLDRARHLYRQQPYFVDLHARFRQRFPESSCVVANGCTDAEDTNLALRDGSHWTLAGQQEAAATLAACASIGGSDGVCTSSVCTAGLIGDACSANADCDLRRCP